MDVTAFKVCLKHFAQHQKSFFVENYTGNYIDCINIKRSIAIWSSGTPWYTLYGQKFVDTGPSHYLFSGVDLYSFRQQHKWNLALMPRAAWRASCKVKCLYVVSRNCLYVALRALVFYVCTLTCGETQFRSASHPSLYCWMAWTTIKFTYLVAFQFAIKTCNGVEVKA